MKVMTQADMALGIVFLTQTAAGVLGNSCLLCFYSYTLLTGQKVKPTDPILNHLVLANNLVVLSMGIHHTMAGLGWKHFLDDTGCKIVPYFYRVARGVSLNITCLLSGFQFTKLCTRNSWLNISTRFQKHSGFCAYLFWILQLLVNVSVPVRMTGPRHNQNLTLPTRYKFCSTGEPQSFGPFLIGAFFFSTDAICFVFMIWASVSMVLVLHRHKERVRHIHSCIPSRRPDHEARAMRTILTLVSLFVSFYCLSAICSLFVSLGRKPDLWLVDSTVLLGTSFSVLSPFVLISHDSRVTQGFYSCSKKTFS